MHKLAKHFLSGLSILLGLFIFNCQNGGSELPNEVRGELVSANNRPAANVKVGLYSVNYIPADSNNHALSFSTKTDASGNYSFQNIPTGEYNVVGLQDSLGFFQGGVKIGMHIAG